MSEIASKAGACPMHATDVAKPEALPASAAPQLTCYQVDPRAAPIIPGRRDRAWMDQTNDHYAYRCLPLSMANTSGWELTSPLDFEVTWNGGQGIDAITARAPGVDPNALRALITSQTALNAPEGSRFKEYMLRVPPYFRTAHEAVAWTFGLEAESYYPTIES